MGGTWSESTGSAAMERVRKLIACSRFTYPHPVPPHELAIAPEPAHRIQQRRTPRVLLSAEQFVPFQAPAQLLHRLLEITQRHRGHRPVVTVATAWLAGDLGPHAQDVGPAPRDAVRPRRHPPPARAPPGGSGVRRRLEPEPRERAVGTAGDSV